MKINFIFLIGALMAISCNDDKRTVNFPKSDAIVTTIPQKEDVSVYILAGQSNMAGRGFVEPKDTIPNKRLLTINKKGELILAKEPLHFYEPIRTGLDCGVSFGQSILEQSTTEYVLLLPTAIGGSSIQQWINDSLYRDVNLLTNFKEKVNIGKKHGTIKGILWHQGETDSSNDQNIAAYQERLSILFKEFRTTVGNDSLPIVLGELGSYSEENEKWQQINAAVHRYAAEDPFSAYINMQDLKSKEDKIHFNADGQREMGKRFAQKLSELTQKQ